MKEDFKQQIVEYLERDNRRLLCTRGRVVTFTDQEAIDQLAEGIVTEFNLPRSILQMFLATGKLAIGSDLYAALPRSTGRQP